MEQPDLNTWTLPLWPTACLLAGGLLYLRGWGRIRFTRQQLFPAWRAACFLGGLVSLWLAMASPVDSLDDVLLAAHMTQHLILMSIAPPLLLLGAPAVPLLRVLPRFIVGPVVRNVTLRSVFHQLTRPMVAWLAMNVTYLVWHTPGAYELALASPGWHQAEHLCFFSTSLLFWFPVIQPRPSAPRGSRWVMLPYLVGADLVNTGFSAFLTFAGRVIYPSYAAAPRVLGISALADQAAAGALMWVIGSICYLIPLAVIAFRLLSPQKMYRPIGVFGMD